MRLRCRNSGGFFPPYQGPVVESVGEFQGLLALEQLDLFALFRQVVGVQALRLDQTSHTFRNTAPKFISQNILDCFESHVRVRQDVRSGFHRPVQGHLESPLIPDLGTERQFR